MTCKQFVSAEFASKAGIKSPSLELVRHLGKRDARHGVLGTLAREEVAAISGRRREASRSGKRGFLPSWQFD